MSGLAALWGQVANETHCVSQRTELCQSQASSADTREGSWILVSSVQHKTSELPKYNLKNLPPRRHEFRTFRCITQLTVSHRPVAPTAVHSACKNGTWNIQIGRHCASVYGTTLTSARHEGTPVIGCKAPLVLKLYTRWRSAVSSTPRPPCRSTHCRVQRRSGQIILLQPGNKPRFRMTCVRLISQEAEWLAVAYCHCQVCSTSVT